jgi:hypothetical protein
MQKSPRNGHIEQASTKEEAVASVHADAIVSRLLSREGVLFGFALALVGGIIWQFKHMRGVGDGVLATAIFVLLPNGLQWVQRHMERSNSAVCDLILRILRLRA